jgi:hypothetical protein
LASSNDFTRYSNTPAEVVMETAIRLCGCQQGDLSENKLMKGRSCLDCQLAVTSMESNACGQCAVVYYCNEGIKGFDAPDDDPMKSALTCDLILCPKCEAKRRIG